MIAKSDRLLMREITLQDADFVLALMNEPAFHEMIADRGLRTVEDAQDYCRTVFQASYRQHGVGFYLLCLRDENETRIGICGLTRREWLSDMDLGYALCSQYWRKGYAYEAASRMLDYAKEELKQDRVLAITSLGNAPSKYLLEKLGFVPSDVVTHPDSGEVLNVLERRLV